MNFQPSATNKLTTIAAGIALALSTSFAVAGEKDMTDESADRGVIERHADQRNIPTPTPDIAEDADGAEATDEALDRVGEARAEATAAVDEATDRANIERNVEDREIVTPTPEPVKDARMAAENAKQRGEEVKTDTMASAREQLDRAKQEDDMTAPAVAADTQKPATENRNYRTTTDTAVVQPTAEEYADRQVRNDAVEHDMDTGPLAELARDNDQLSTFAKAVKTAGLTKALATDGEYTIFAPTNDAFAALPEGELEELLKPENREALRELLRGHIVAGTVKAEQAKTLTEAQVLTGDTVAVTAEEEGLRIGDATIVDTDLNAGGITIHTVDTIIGAPKDAIAATDTDEDDKEEAEEE